MTWDSILASVGFDELGELDVALRTAIHGLKRSVQRVDLADSLHKYLEAHGLVRPEEGDVPSLLENRLLSAVRNLGHESLWVGDEFWGGERTFRS